MGRITHRRAELSGSSAGGLPRLGHWAMTGTSLAPLPNQDLAWDHISKVSLARLYTLGHMIKNTASNPPFFGGVRWWVLEHSGNTALRGLSFSPSHTAWSDAGVTSEPIVLTW